MGASPPYTFFLSAVSAALREPHNLFRRSRCMRKHPVDALRAANGACKGDHARQINSDWTIASFTKHTVPENERFHFFEHCSINLTTLLVKLAERIDYFVRRHILWITIVTPKKETAVSAQSAPCTKLQKRFHFSLLSVQHFLHLLFVNRLSLYFRHVHVSPINWWAEPSLQSVLRYPFTDSSS